MPTYVYRCQADQSQIEMYQSLEDSSIPNCPVCSQQMSKQYQATPAHFRGTGWGGH